jgi:hypothetical protein
MKVTFKAKLDIIQNNPMTILEKCALACVLQTTCKTVS